MEQKPTDFTEGRTFWQFMFMSKGKIFVFCFLHLVCAFGAYRLLGNGGIEGADSDWGYYTAWTIIVLALSAYWIGSIRHYRLLKKGQSR